MSQSNLFPLKLLHEEEFSGTKDLKCIGHAIGGTRYAVKKESDGELLPLAEWLGHHISRLCGIPTPDFEIVECLNGELAFGSRWEENSISLTNGTPTVDVLLMLSIHAEAISEILGLDHHLNNHDRHCGNFLFVPRNNKQICLSMDFSCANVRNGLPFGEDYFKEGCNTLLLMNGVMVNHLSKLSKKSFNAALDAVQAITYSQISTILTGAPDAWFTLVNRSQILDWWKEFSVIRAESKKL